MLFWQILVDGFAISSLYALGATGFALIFGVSGVLNLSHGALMVAAVVAAWAAGNDLHVGPYAGATLGVAVGFVATMLTYFIIVRPLQQTRKIREEE
jgi:branched-chain amino acid transport system permease protein